MAEPILNDHGLEVIRKSGRIRNSEVVLKVISSPVNGPSVDAFSRFRVSNPFGVFDNKNIFGSNPDNISSKLSGGGTVTHVPAKSEVELSVGTSDGDLATRQTNRYFAYVPGKSHMIVMTGILGAGQTGTVKRMGYFDDLNGVFFEQNGNDLNVNIRSNTSGSVVDNSVSQSDWNLDTLDGSGPSKVTFDETKAHIIIMDLQWLGVGRVRIGIDISGEIVYFHEFNHSNLIESAYMATASLPVRYEIRNTQAVSGVATLKEICMSVSSEGGYTLPGFEYSVNNGDSGRSLSVGVKTPILAIRLVNTHESKPNRVNAKYVKSNFFAVSSPLLIEIGHIHDPSSVTAAWNPVGSGSAVEFSTDISAITTTVDHTVDSLYVPSGQANRGSAASLSEGFITNHNFISQNIDADNSQIFVIYATSIGGSATGYSAITWIEFN